MHRGTGHLRLWRFTKEGYYRGLLNGSFNAVLEGFSTAALTIGLGFWGMYY